MMKKVRQIQMWDIVKAVGLFRIILMSQNPKEGRWYGQDCEKLKKYS